MLLPRRITGRHPRDEWREVGDALGMMPGDRGLVDVDDVTVVHLRLLGQERGRLPTLLRSNGDSLLVSSIQIEGLISAVVMVVTK